MTFVDIVDDKEKVLGSLPVEEVHKKGLLHRSVHLIVIDNSGKILCRIRPSWKKRYPGFWSLVGAHLEAGESYEEGAKKLLSQIGINAQPEFLGKIRINDGIENEISAIFLVKIKGEKPKLSDSLAQSVSFLSIDEIRQLKKKTPYLVDGLKLL